MENVKRDMMRGDPRALAGKPPVAPVFCRRTRGIAMVELALVLPVLLLLTFGVIEFGWMFTVTSQMTNAVRNGARLGVRADATSADVEAEIDAYMAAAGLEESGYSVEIEPAEVLEIDPGTAITVTVTVPYENVEVTGFPLPMPDNLVVSVTMVKEGPS